jgi:DNA sulfur modification protein DndC
VLFWAGRGQFPRLKVILRRSLAILTVTGTLHSSETDSSSETLLWEDTRSYLRATYLVDQRPWVVAFSGGKDSTLVLQLVYEMLLALEPGLRKPVFVIASDTGVEPPNVAQYLEATLKLVDDGSKAHSLPIEIHLVRPMAAEAFWTKMIGRGYPSPTRWFRWCTKNIKVNPARRVIEGIAGKYGSVVLLLGTRHSESSARGQRMQARLHNERGLNPHHEIPNALVATPISEWTTDQVWTFLLKNNPPPWGGSHDFMLDLYRQAGGGECPLVLDLDTAPCGGSRFGCWTCTVVKEDKSMAGFIEGGEEWMEPLRELRNWLKSIRENSELRAPLRRDGTPGPGPFTPGCRRIILERLFETERSVGIQLISDEEIRSIQAEWSNEFDLTNSAVTLAATYGREVDAVPDMTLPPKEAEIINSLINQHNVPTDLVYHLLFLVNKKFPSLEIHGAKAALQREVRAAIEKFVDNQTAPDHEDDL